MYVLEKMTKSMVNLLQQSKQKDCTCVCLGPKWSTTSTQGLLIVTLISDLAVTDEQKKFTAQFVYKV